MRVKLGLTEEEMVMVDKFIVMEIIILDIGRTIRKMVKAKRFILRVEKSKKVSGKMANSEAEIKIT